MESELKIPDKDHEKEIRDHVEHLTAECAFYRQALENCKSTDFVRPEARIAFIDHIFETCEDGKLMLDRYRLRIQENADLKKRLTDLATIARQQEAMILKLKAEIEEHVRFQHIMIDMIEPEDEFFAATTEHVDALSRIRKGELPAQKVVVFTDREAFDAARKGEK